MLDGPRQPHPPPPPSYILSCMFLLHAMATAAVWAAAVPTISLAGVPQLLVFQVVPSTSTKLDCKLQFWAVSPAGGDKRPPLPPDSRSKHWIVPHVCVCSGSFTTLNPKPSCGECYVVESRPRTCRSPATTPPVLTCVSGCRLATCIPVWVGIALFTASACPPMQVD